MKNLVFLELPVAVWKEYTSEITGTRRVLKTESIACYISVGVAQSSLQYRLSYDAIDVLRVSARLHCVELLLLNSDHRFSRPDLLIRRLSDRLWAHHT